MWTRDKEELANLFNTRKYATTLTILKFQYHALFLQWSHSKRTQILLWVEEASGPIKNHVLVGHKKKPNWKDAEQFCKIKKWYFQKQI